LPVRAQGLCLFALKPETVHFSDKSACFYRTAKVSQANHCRDSLKSASCYLWRMQHSCSHTTRFAHCSLTATIRLLQILSPSEQWIAHLCVPCAVTTSASAGTPLLTLRSLTLYIYGAPILDVSRSHTTTQHSR